MIYFFHFPVMSRNDINHSNRSKNENNGHKLEHRANQCRDRDGDKGLTDQVQEVRGINLHCNNVDPPQKFVERAKIREKYQNLCTNLEEEASRDQKVNDEVFEKLEETLESADQSYRKVGAAGKELAADADVLLSMTKLLVNRMYSFKNEKTERVFSYQEFAEKIVEFVRIRTSLNRIDSISDVAADNSLLLEAIPAYEDDEEIPLNDFGKLNNRQWAWLGRKYASVLNVGPSFSFLRAVIKNCDPIPTQQKPKKERICRRKNEKEEAVFLKHMQYTDNEISVSKELDVVRRCMRLAWKNNNTSQIPFYPFVIDPGDFSKTVQNMFYVSFLIKDAQARLKLGDDQLPYLERVTSEERADLHVDDRSAVTTKQAIIGFNYDIWEAMVAALNITTPAIFSAE